MIYFITLKDKYIYENYKINLKLNYHLFGHYFGLHVAFSCIPNA